MKRAVISDIHSNLEAFEVVLADIKKEKVDEIYCLGDLVGYGPNPRECIDLMIGLGSKVKACLLGNHDNAAIFNPDGFNHVAEQAIYWTRSQIENARGLRAEERFLFIGERPHSFKNGELMFVHGSSRNPLNEYVFSEDIKDPEKMKKLFSINPRYCFQGHTHVPGIFIGKGSCSDLQDFSYLEFKEIKDGIYHLEDDEKLLINVGSVGQPRDKDPRACYVIFHEDRIEYRRLEYDFEKTCEKIYNIPELDNFLGDRLKRGR